MHGIWNPSLEQELSLGSQVPHIFFLLCTRLHGDGRGTKFQFGLA